MLRLRLPFLLLWLLGWLATPAARAQNLANLSQQKPVAATGTLDVRVLLYGCSGNSAARRRPASYVLSGVPTVNLYGVAVPPSCVPSGQDRAVRQLFNQFGLSPTYKWALSALAPAQESARTAETTVRR